MTDPNPESRSDQSRSVPDVVARALAAHAKVPGALLPVLHAIVDALGHVPPAAIAPIARGLNLSRADVHGVITFYADFRTTPPGRHRLRICLAEACQSMGSEALAEHLRLRHGCAVGETRADGVLTVEATYCLGNCALSPAVMVDHDGLIGRVSPNRIDELVTEWERG